MTPRKKPESKPYVAFNALLPPAMHRALRLRALEMGIPATEIVRQAITRYLEGRAKR